MHALLAGWLAGWLALKSIHVAHRIPVRVGRVTAVPSDSAEANETATRTASHDPATATAQPQLSRSVPKHQRVEPRRGPRCECASISRREVSTPTRSANRTSTVSADRRRPTDMRVALPVSVACEGFEPPNAKQSDLQSDPFGHLGNMPSNLPRRKNQENVRDKNTSFERTV